MSLLLNRKYGSRLECLHAIAKYLYYKYQSNSLSFSLNDIKFDEFSEITVHNYCTLLSEQLGFKFCPFLDNPLNESKCYATQSLKSDSTKSKAVSDIGGSLEALGIIVRNNLGKYSFTRSGITWINLDFYSEEWTEKTTELVKSYGPIIGFLFDILLEKELKGEIILKNLYIGYPLTQEYALNNSQLVKLDHGTEKDTNTRTRTRLTSWSLATGLLKEVGSIITNIPQIQNREILNSDRFNLSKLEITPKLLELFETKFYVENPLSYERLNKAVASRRENGMDIIRQETLRLNKKILDRRFAICFVLNEMSKKDRMINWNEFLYNLELKKEHFVDPYSYNNFTNIIASEMSIAKLVGIPFKVKLYNNETYIIPLTIINENILSLNVDQNIINISKEIFQNLKNKGAL